MNAAYTLGRILLPLVFLVAGIQKLMNIREIADLLVANKIPIPDEVVPYLGSIWNINELPSVVKLGSNCTGLERLASLFQRATLGWWNRS